MENQGKWFVVNTLSGQENKVRALLENTMLIEGETFGMYQVLMPAQTVTEVRNGKKATFQRKLYPGYLFIRMDLYEPGTRKRNEKVWYTIRETQGVIGFIGNADNPMWLTEREVADLMQQIAPTEEHTKPVSIYKVGERVRIKEGAFENFDGEIEEIDVERGKLKIMVSIFGRMTPVELEFSQVERYTE